MANSLRNPFSPGSSIRYSNRATDSFLMTWMVAANDGAQTAWQQLFVAWLGERTQLLCPPGMAGFDLLDLPWTAPHVNAERQFFVRSCFAFQELLTEHVGGVLASGFADDGNRSRGGRERRRPLLDVVDLQQRLLNDARVLETWFRRLPLDDLQARVASQNGPRYPTPWRDDPFPDSVAGLRRCTTHMVMYAPRQREVGCSLCQDAAEYIKTSRLLG